MTEYCQKTKWYIHELFHKLKFYPSGDNHTQALLVMLVTNIVSGGGLVTKKVPTDVFLIEANHVCSVSERHIAPFLTTRITQKCTKNAFKETRLILGIFDIVEPPLQYLAPFWLLHILVVNLDTRWRKLHLLQYICHQVVRVVLVTIASVQKCQEL